MADDAGNNGTLWRPRSLMRAVRLGIAVFFITAGVVILGGIILVAAVNVDESRGCLSDPQWWKKIGLLIMLASPVVGLIGALSGHENYRFAAGQSRAWAGLVALVLMTIPLLLLHRDLFTVSVIGVGVVAFVHRENRIAARKGHAYSQILLLGILLVIAMAGACRSGLGNVGLSLAWCTCASLLVGDAIIAHLIERSRRWGVIPEETRAFQFSLKTLFFFSLALSGYVMFLAQLIGKK